MEESPTTESPLPSEAADAPPPEEAPATYMVSEWAGLAYYVCTDCGHGTFDLDQQAAHQTLMHAGVMRALVVERPTTTPADAGAVGTAPLPQESAPEATGTEGTEGTEAATDEAQDDV